MELYRSQQQRKLNQNHKVLQQVLIHSPAKKWFTNYKVYISDVHISVIKP